MTWFLKHCLANRREETRYCYVLTLWLLTRRLETT